MEQDLILIVGYIFVNILLIDYLQVKIPLFVIGLTNVAVSIIFTSQANTGMYISMFGTDISSIWGIYAIINIITLSMWTLPILAFLKTYYLDKLLDINDIDEYYPEDS
jgi:hypothetical protein